jgi:HAD superfamily hydrolase (TIGR01509 family)
MKLIIFDLDGVLVDAKFIHYETLNTAIEVIAGSEYAINQSEHLSTYEGLKTNQKLELLTLNKQLNVKLHNDIWNLKQKLTTERISNLQKNEKLVSLFKKLKGDNYKIACCSNSIRKSIFIMLSKIGVIEYMDLILSNEDVVNSKPHPEIYWQAMAKLNCLPEDTLIVEDSPNGLLAAYRSTKNVLRVKNVDDVTYDNIMNKIQNINMKIDSKIPKWKDNKLNVLIPMAGAGSRFEKAGYTFPKPLIDVNGKPMIQVVTENINIDANFIYIVQKKHRSKYNLDTLLNLITPNCTIIDVDGITEGAACTALLAKDFINNANPLFFANSDQFIEWNSNEFFYKMNETDCDGGIVTFKSTHPKWSFVKVDKFGLANEVAEKNPISDIATVGVYFWKHGSDFVKYSEQMISKNIRVNNEFYICPVFNEAIKDNKKIKIFDIQKMWGLGTPEDLNFFLENYSKTGK